MKDYTNPVPYVTVVFFQFTLKLMLGVGLVLEETVTRAPPLPPNYALVWANFFAKLAELRAATMRHTPFEIPEIALALDGIKNAIRELSGLIEARLHSRNETTQEAAERLKANFFPEGLEVVTDAEHDVLGWTSMTIGQLEETHAADVRAIRARPEVTSLKDALQNYVDLSAEYFVEPEPEEEPKSIRRLLDEARGELRFVMIELSHLCIRHPDFVPVVNMMIKPLDELAEKIRAEQKKNRKASDDTSDSSNDSDDASEATETESESAA